ncbi:hypothetical protein L6164_034536 [Bauhinia variegata]|uniref:Uncharacterized protein n=1 Tax=Bauhinia variegata TaxID=167791 RepID=A0ACB9KV17_BAUVA|nr:hypothetical protein L6164_034536 [Bauhinia variegata]
MPATLRTKYLNLCFSKILRPLEADQSPPMTPILSNSSLPHHHRASPLPINNNSSSSPSFLIKNFNSLYEDSTAATSSSLSRTSTTTSAYEPELERDPEPADFATVFASQRFFFSSPGRSNSIIESSNAECTTSSPSSSETKSDQKIFNFNNSVAVPTYSPDPYLDFRRSMQEMVEARPELMDVKSNWEILHELLLCYLALNPKTTHNYIVSAFADLLVTLMSSSQPKPDELGPGGGDGG